MYLKFLTIAGYLEAAAFLSGLLIGWAQHNFAAGLGKGVAQAVIVGLPLLAIMLVFWFGFFLTWIKKDKAK